MYPLNDLEGDSGATYVVELGHGVHGYDKAGHSMHLPLLPHHRVNFQNQSVMTPRGTDEEDI
jgi:hypothetical protein